MRSFRSRLSLNREVHLLLIFVLSFLFASRTLQPKRRHVFLFKAVTFLKNRFRYGKEREYKTKMRGQSPRHSALENPPSENVLRGSFSQ